ncbi:MAG: shikimate kinase [Acidobacteriota bacterium]|nr:shikimate kinase [Acidobacteriota bacterium]
MEGYYDHHATLQLNRPLAVAGMIGSPYRHTAYHVSSRTGLPFTDLDRKIEHEAGQSLWDLVTLRGEPALRELERKVLLQTLRARPAGIIALGDGTLLDADNKRAVLESTTLVHLEMDLAANYWHIRRHEEEHGRFWNPFLPSPITRIEELRPVFQQLEPSLRDAHWVLPAAGRHSSQLALEIIGRLQEVKAG